MLEISNFPVCYRLNASKTKEPRRLEESQDHRHWILGSSKHLLIAENMMIILKKMFLKNLSLKLWNPDKQWRAKQSDSDVRWICQSEVSLSGAMPSNLLKIVWPPEYFSLLSLFGLGSYLMLNCVLLLASIATLRRTKNVSPVHCVEAQWHQNY